MYKVTIKEVTEKFDVEGNLTERVTRTETTEDDEVKGTVAPYWTSTISSADAPKDVTGYTSTNTTQSGIGIK